MKGKELLKKAVNMLVSRPDYLYDKSDIKGKEIEYNENTKQDILTLIKYIQLLYQYLNVIQLCFTAGSFIIEDNEEKLLYLLLQSSTYNLRGFSSHESFGPVKIEKTVNKIKFTCERVCETNIVGKFNNDPVNISCSYSGLSDSRNIRNIKWYQFINKENNIKFIFFKLETRPTQDFIHAINGYNHYVRQKATKTVFQSRREDCNKTDDGCGYTKADFKKDITELVFDDGEKIEIIENYGERIGDEFFIPQKLNEFLISISQNKKKIDITKASDIGYITVV